MPFRLNKVSIVTIYIQLLQNDDNGQSLAVFFHHTIDNYDCDQCRVSQFWWIQDKSGFLSEISIF